MAFGWQLLGWLSALGVVVTVEQLIAAGLWRLHGRQLPLVSDPVPGGQYERSLFTPAAAPVRMLWLGLAITATLLWLGRLEQPWPWLLTLPALLLCLDWDLRHREAVVISPWQVAWRRGWGRPVRRLPLEQIAHVHLMQRGVWRGQGRLAFIANQWLGSTYLALQLQDGSAVKLPRTGRRLGHAQVEQVARELRRRKHRLDRERARQMRREHYERLRRRESAAVELALRRELLGLRLSARREAARRARQARTEGLQFDLTLPSDLQDLPTTRPASLGPATSPPYGTADR